MKKSSILSEFFLKMNKAVKYGILFSVIYMITKLKNYWEENKFLLVCLGVILFLVFGVYIFGLQRFVLGYDYQYQHLYFYQDFHRLIKSGQIPFWSNNLFLGTNFWGSKSYYILGDPFAYITLLFPSSLLISSLLLTYILKFITAALLFNQLLIKMNIKKEIRFIPVLLYTFCGWATLFCEHPMFLVWHTFLPLLLLGMEYALQDKKYTVFILGVFLCFVSNYYFFWTTSVFMTFYWTIRYYQNHPFIFKNYLLDTLKLIGFYLVGVLMAMFLVLPSILHLIQNTRVSEAAMITKKWNPIIIYLDIIVKTLIAPFQVSELGQMLFNTTAYSTNQLSLYSSVLTIILLPQIFTALKGKTRNGFIALFIILTGLLITPYGASLMHGFKEPTFRWTLLFITCMVIAAAHVLNNLEHASKKVLLASLGLILITVFGLRFAARHYYDAIWDHLKPEYNSLLLAAGFAVLYTILLIKQKSKLALFVFTALLVSELSLGAYKTLHRYPAFEDFDYENTLSSEAVQYIDSLEDENSFYRIYVPYLHTNADMPHNLNLYYGYKGTYTYDSLYQFTLGDFVEEKLHISAGMWQLQIQNFDLLKQHNTKYFMVQDPEFNLGKPQWHQEIVNLNDYPEFKLLKEVDGYMIYEVTDYTPFALTLSKNTDNHLIGTVNQTNDGVVELTIAFDKGWNVKVNGQKTECFPINGGFIGFNAEVGDTVELTFIPNGFIPGSILSILGLLGFIIIFYKELTRA